MISILGCCYNTKQLFLKEKRNHYILRVIVKLVMTVMEPHRTMCFTDQPMDCPILQTRVHKKIFSSYIIIQSERQLFNVIWPHSCGHMNSASHPFTTVPPIHSAHAITRTTFSWKTILGIHGRKNQKRSRK